MGPDKSQVDGFAAPVTDRQHGPLESSVAPLVPGVASAVRAHHVRLPATCGGAAWSCRPHPTRATARRPRQQQPHKRSTEGRPDTERQRAGDRRHSPTSTSRGRRTRRMARTHQQQRGRRGRDSVRCSHSRYCHSRTDLSSARSLPLLRCCLSESESEFWNWKMKTFPPGASLRSGASRDAPVDSAVVGVVDDERGEGGIPVPPALVVRLPSPFERLDHLGRV